MKRKLFSILSVFLLLTMLTSTVSAGGNIKLSGAFRLGSLIFDGTLTGVGGYSEGITVTLTATGNPVVTCTNQGGSQAPGQNPPKVTTSGNQFIEPSDIDEKGKAGVSVETDEPVLTAKRAGCPSNRWTVSMVVFWTDATVVVTDSATGARLLEQVYTCDPTQQTATSVSCTLVSETSFH